MFNNDFPIIIINLYSEFTHTVFEALHKTPVAVGTRPCDVVVTIKYKQTQHT